MKTTFPLKKILILVAILALPGFLYYLLKEKGRNRYHPLEIYGPKQVASTWHTFHGKKIQDTIYHRVGDLTLLNDRNKPVHAFSDTSSIKIVAFFYDHAVNRDITLGAVDGLAKEYKRNKRIRFVSISVNRTDFPGKLTELANRYKSQSKKWDFLSGSDTLIHQLATKRFFADVLRDSTREKSYIVSPMLILLDPWSRIRGYYDSTNPAQTAKLSDEIKVLITEELRKIKAP